MPIGKAIFVISAVGYALAIIEVAKLRYLNTNRNDRLYTQASATTALAMPVLPDFFALQTKSAKTQFANIDAIITRTTPGSPQA